MPEQFAADWLALREAADHAARDTGLLQALHDWWPDTGYMQITDLGTGTGSNLRYLAPRLTGTQHWRLIDHDPALLERALATAGTLPDDPGLHIQGECIDLHDDLESAVQGADLVTASALLDLVSREWLDRLAACCAREGAAILIALSYDGRFEFTPAQAEDALIRRSVNAHQRGRKDMGMALGPDAAKQAAQALAAAGYTVHLASSDWQLGPADPALQAALINGWCAAAREHNPAAEARINAWEHSRIRQGPADSLRVGHQDLLALPPCPA